MQTIIKKDRKEAGESAFQVVKSAILDKGVKTLGLASGSSMLELYGRLAGAFRKGELDFSDVSTFNLGEYIGLAADDPQSLRFFMESNLFAHLNLKPSNVHFPDGLADCVEEECSYFEQEMESLGGIKLQLLGIGSNGHIGFNEPGSPMESRSRYVTLTESTLSDNGRFFRSRKEIPRWALTMGIGTILDAQEILLIATGENKANAVRDMIEGPISQNCPASFLQIHPNVTVILDEDAASLLKSRSHWIRCADDYDEMMDFLFAARHKAGIE